MKFGTASLIAAMVMVLAFATNSAHAQVDEACVLRCDEANSKVYGDCILPYKGKPKDPVRRKCLEDAYNEWVDCKENCYD